MRLIHVQAGPAAWLLCRVLLCGAAIAPLQAEDMVSLEHQDAAGLFAEKCGMCHRGNGMGTVILARRLDPEQALLENRSDLQPAFIENVVRSGFGVMFPLSRGEVSDEQLGKIIAYLQRETEQ